MHKISVKISEKEMDILRLGGSVDAGGYGETVRVSLEAVGHREPAIQSGTINVVVITCDHGHVHALADNELFSDPEKAEERFIELIKERHQ